MLNIVLGILLIVMAVFLVVTILLQSSKDHRMSGTIAGGAETFFGKQKGKTIDGVLNKITVVVCILFFVCVLAMYITTDSGYTTPIVDKTPVVENEVETDVEGEAEAEVEGEVEAEAEAETEAETEAEAEPAAE